MGRVWVHLRMCLHHGEERARRVRHELILRRAEHGLVVRVEAGVQRGIRELRLGMVDQAHVRLGHRVLRRVRSSRGVGVLWRKTLEGGSGDRGARAVFSGRRDGRGMGRRLAWK